MNNPSRSIFIGFAALALAGAARPAKMSQEETVPVQAALNRGHLLYDLDQAAWITTDDMLERLGRSDPPIKGWVIERAASGGGYAVTYFGDGAAGPVAWYAGAVRNGKIVASEVFAEGKRPPLTPAQLRLKEAADAARAFTGYQPCTPRRFNVAIVPPATAAGPIEAYLLSAQTERNVYPMGGHYRLQISGGKVVSHRRFMKSCMNMNIADSGKGAPVSVIVSHLLDPTPTEIHVFMSMWMRKPVYVATGKTLWVVEGPQISIIKKD